MEGHRDRDDRGAVTAETAVALPLLALFTLAMAWLVCVGLTEVRAMDAAREVARAAARSDSSASATALGRRVAPAGSSISLERGDGTVEATVRSPVHGGGGLLAALSGIRVTGRAVAALEPEQ